MKLFNNRKLFQAKIITEKLKANLLLNASICIHRLTFIIKALHLVASVGCSLVPHYLSLLGRHSQRAMLLRPRPSIISIASVI